MSISDNAVAFGEDGSVTVTNKVGTKINHHPERTQIDLGSVFKQAGVENLLHIAKFTRVDTEQGVDIKLVFVNGGTVNIAVNADGTLRHFHGTHTRIIVPEEQGTVILAMKG